MYDVVPGAGQSRTNKTSWSPWTWNEACQDYFCDNYTTKERRWGKNGLAEYLQPAESYSQRDDNARNEPLASDTSGASSQPKQYEHATPLDVASWNRPPLAGPTPAPSGALNLVLGNAHASGEPAPNALWLETDTRCEPRVRSLKNPQDNPQQGIWNPDKLPLRWMEAFDKFLLETPSSPDYPRALCMDMSAGLDQSQDRTHDLHEIRNHSSQPQQSFNRAEIPGKELATTYSGAIFKPVRKRRRFSDSERERIKIVRKTPACKACIRRKQRVDRSLLCLEERG